MAAAARSPRSSLPIHAVLLGVLAALSSPQIAIAQPAPVWVGHVKAATGLPGAPGGSGPYHLGRGGATPGADLNGMWTWDHNQPGEPDSLQGWWPIVRPYTIGGESAVPDFERPWWALDHGNQASYAVPQGLKRTFGVIGVWHRDAGALVPHPEIAAATPAWMPLAGSHSAWMGLRAKGDNAYVDPITGNPINQTVLDFNGENTGASSGTAKNFPGYGSQMDQMLYRDIDLLGVSPGTNLVVSFQYRTTMSTGFDGAAGTRTGWFHHDPLQATDGGVGSNQAPGNFISSTDAGGAAPRDSFMVYVGAPTEGSFLGSDGFQRPIHDPARRWFSETVRSVEGLYREIFARAGSDSGNASIVVPAAVLAPMLSASGGRLRLVFRVKTNRGFDDQDGAFASYGRGAVQVDAVTYSAGTRTSPAGWGEFEAPSSIDNALFISALNAWKSTGKPPQPFPHVHALDDLVFMPGDPSACALADGVISAGNHDEFESIPGGYPGTAQGQLMQALASPAINLVSPGPGSFNAMGIDADIAAATLDYFLRYEVYTGAVDPANTGVSVTIGVQSFPVLQSNGVRCWSDLRTLTRTLEGPPNACLTMLEPLRSNGLIRTSNGNGIPDSLRVFLAIQTQPGSQPFPSQDGVYFDHVSLGFFDLSFAQLDFKSDTAVLVDSDLGRCAVKWTPASVPAFLNVVARVPGEVESGWIVRNLYLPRSADAPPLEDLGTRFPLSLLGVSQGETVAALEYDLRIGPDPLTDADAATWLASAEWRTPVPVSSTTLQQGGYLGVEQSLSLALVPPFFPPYHPPIDILTRSWIGCRMPNVDLDDSTRAGELNGCAPAGVANSMRWLDDKHDQFSIPGNLRDAFNQLSDLMNRMRGEGATDREILKAKLDFIEAHGLPIHVKYQSKLMGANIPSTTGLTHATNENAAGGWPTNAWLQSESARGEDVELAGSWYYRDASGTWRSVGGHVVVLTGSGYINKNPWITYKDDGDQERPGGIQEDFSAIDTTGGVIRVPGLDGPVKDANGNWVYGRFVVETVFSESYDPSVGAPPAQHTFGEYCQWFLRTLAPRKKLVLTFPHSTRCFNVTVWVLDRTVKPPVWRKKQVWNFNSDSTRVYANDTDSCVTVAVHNDDNRRNGPAYVPWTLPIAIANLASEATSASNEHAYGGFSVGGMDSSSGEFGDPAGPHVTVDASLGCELSAVPERLGAGVEQLTLTHPIPQWNEFWSHLELRLAVASVAGPGLLQIDCPSSGHSGSLLIDQPGSYVVDLGTVGTTSQFSITLGASPGLDFAFDAIGLASTIDPVSGVDPRPAPAVAGLFTLGANPLRESIAFRIDLSARSEVDLSVYDVAGRQVATLASGMWQAGSYPMTWSARDANGRPVPNGLYFCRLATDRGVWTARWIVIR